MSGYIGEDSRKLGKWRICPQHQNLSLGAIRDRCHLHHERFDLLALGAHVAAAAGMKK